MSEEAQGYGYGVTGIYGPDEQVGGSHYKDMPIDVYEFAETNGLTPMQFNVVRHICRFKKKNGMEDLLKAMRTIKRMIEFYYGNKDQEIEC